MIYFPPDASVKQSIEHIVYFRTHSEHSGVMMSPGMGLSGHVFGHAPGISWMQPI